MQVKKVTTRVREEVGLGGGGVDKGPLTYITELSPRLSLPTGPNLGPLFRIAPNLRPLSKTKCGTFVSDRTAPNLGPSSV